MTRPVQGQAPPWGNGLNGWLDVGHNADGTTKATVSHTELGIGGSTTVSPGVPTPLPIGDIEAVTGDTILDISNPLLPAVIETGIYSFTVTVMAIGGSGETGTATARLNLDYSSGNDWVTDTTLIVGVDNFQASMSMTTYMPAGGTFKVVVTSSATGNANFEWNLGEVQRII